MYTKKYIVIPFLFLSVGIEIDFQFYSFIFICYNCISFISLYFLLLFQYFPVHTHTFIMQQTTAIMIFIYSYCISSFLYRIFYIHIFTILLYCCTYIRLSFLLQLLQLFLLVVVWLWCCCICHTDSLQVSVSIKLFPFMPFEYIHNHQCIRMA